MAKNVGESVRRRLLNLARGPRDFLARYLAGQHEAVWRDLVAIGPIMDSALREEVQQVATETMRRVRGWTIRERAGRRMAAGGREEGAGP